MATKGNSLVRKDLALVMRAAPYREADLMLTLFTRSEGLQTARAYGARSFKSAIRAACQPFILAEFEFYEKRGRYSVKAAEIRAAFSRLQENYEALACGSVILELTEKVLRYAYEFEDLFVLTVSALTALDKESAPSRDVLLFFLLRLAHYLGVFPALRRCCVCGAPVDVVTRWSASEGGAVCEECAKTRLVRDDVRDAVPLIASFGRGQISSLEAAGNAEVAVAVNLLLDYVQEQFDMRLRTRKSLRF